MKEQTPTQLLSSFLLFLLSLFALVGAACSPNVAALPGPQTQASAAPGSTPQRAEVVAAIVTTEKAILRRTPSGSAAVVIVVNKGALLSLLDTTPVGPWYRVRDSKTDDEGWVHGNAIALLHTIATNTAPTDGRSDRTASTTERTRVPNTASPSETNARATSAAASPTSTTSERPRRTTPPSADRSYVNVDGIRVPSPVFSETKPAGATARCRDGSYSFSQHRSGTCSHHGGVAEWF